MHLQPVPCGLPADGFCFKVMMLTVQKYNLKKKKCYSISFRKPSKKKILKIIAKTDNKHIQNLTLKKNKEKTEKSNKKVPNWLKK